jgi:hypothetical protein
MIITLRIGLCHELTNVSSKKSIVEEPYGQRWGAVGFAFVAKITGKW